MTLQQSAETIFEENEVAGDEEGVSTTDEPKEDGEDKKDEDDEADEKKEEKLEHDEDEEGEGEGEAEMKTELSKPPAKGGRPRKLTNQFNFCERAALTYNNPTRVSLKKKGCKLVQSEFSA